MPIDEARAEECFYLLAQILNTDDDSEYNFEGSIIKIKDFVPVLMKHLFKTVMKYEGKSEDIMNFMVDAIHYTLKYSNEAPNVNFVTPEQLEFMNHNGHTEPKFVVGKKKKK